MKPRFLSLDPQVPAHDYWDQNIVDELLCDLPFSDRQVVVIPGARQAELVDDINMELAQYPKVLVIITSDEEANFPTEKLYHPDMILYVQYPRMPKHAHADRFLPIGTPPMPKLEIETKKLPWFFAGQVNHESRQKLVEVLREMSLGKLIESPGFAQGLPRDEYLKWMNLASVVPCPGGPHSPDSFRLYEALELGAIPIADHPEFWNMMYGEYPFPAPADWSTLKGLIENLKDRPEEGNRCMAWWMRQKRQMRYNLEVDLKILPDEVTVLVPTSPIPSHPQAGIIEQTIDSVRERLPKSEIILMFDGVREKQKDRTKDYIEYTRRLLWKCRDWGNVYPMIFDSHQHQANMTREALKIVRTPFVMFVEQDTPLCERIPFEKIYNKIRLGEANLVRLMHEAHILDEHKYLMIDPEPIDEFTRTAQFSARPHIASTEYYKWMIDKFFSPDSRTYIEDNMYGVLYNAWKDRGMPGWNEHKVVIYTPEGDMKRSYHTDGREGDPKWNEDLVF